MFGFRRRKDRPSAGTADTFVEATGGGWSDSPEVVAGDGGSQADFVGQTLERARAYALENNIPVGQEFEYTIADIPLGISSPHEILFGLMVRAGEQGLRANSVLNETVFFTRLG